MSLVDFAVQVWKGAEPILGKGPLLYLVTVFVKTVLQDGNGAERCAIL